MVQLDRINTANFNLTQALSNGLLQVLWSYTEGPFNVQYIAYIFV